MRSSLSGLYGLYSLYHSNDCVEMCTIVHRSSSVEHVEHVELTKAIQSQDASLLWTFDALASAARRLTYALFYNLPG